MNTAGVRINVVIVALEYARSMEGEKVNVKNVEPVTANMIVEDLHVMTAVMVIANIKNGEQIVNFVKKVKSENFPIQENPKSQKDRRYRRYRRYRENRNVNRRPYHRIVQAHRHENNKQNTKNFFLFLSTTVPHFGTNI